MPNDSEPNAAGVFQVDVVPDVGDSLAGFDFGQPGTSVSPTTASLSKSYTGRTAAALAPLALRPPGKAQPGRGAPDGRLPLKGFGGIVRGPSSGFSIGSLVDAIEADEAAKGTKADKAAAEQALDNAATAEARADGLKAFADALATGGDPEQLGASLSKLISDLPEDQRDELKTVVDEVVHTTDTTVAPTESAHKDKTLFAAIGMLESANTDDASWTDDQIKEAIEANDLDAAEVALLKLWVDSHGESGAETKKAAAKGDALALTDAEITEAVAGASTALAAKLKKYAKDHGISIKEAYAAVIDPSTSVGKWVERERERRKRAKARRVRRKARRKNILGEKRATLIDSSHKTRQTIQAQRAVAIASINTQHQLRRRGDDAGAQRVARASDRMMAASDAADEARRRQRRTARNGNTAAAAGYAVKAAQLAHVSAAWGKVITAVQQRMAQEDAAASREPPVGENVTEHFKVQELDATVEALKTEKEEKEASGEWTDADEKELAAAEAEAKSKRDAWNADVRNGVFPLDLTIWPNCPDTFPKSCTTSEGGGKDAEWCYWRPGDEEACDLIDFEEPGPDEWTNVDKDGKPVDKVGGAQGKGDVQDLRGHDAIIGKAASVTAPPDTPGQYPPEGWGPRKEPPDPPPTPPGTRAGAGTGTGPGPEGEPGPGVSPEGNGLGELTPDGTSNEDGDRYGETPGEDPPPEPEPVTLKEKITAAWERLHNPPFNGGDKKKLAKQMCEEFAQNLANLKAAAAGASAGSDQRAAMNGAIAAAERALAQCESLAAKGGDALNTVWQVMALINFLFEVLGLLIVEGFDAIEEMQDWVVARFGELAEAAGLSSKVGETIAEVMFFPSKVTGALLKAFAWAIGSIEEWVVEKVQEGTEEVTGSEELGLLAGEFARMAINLGTLELAAGKAFRGLKALSKTPGVRKGRAVQDAVDGGKQLDDASQTGRGGRGRRSGRTPVSRRGRTRRRKREKTPEGSNGPDGSSKSPGDSQPHVPTPVPKKFRAPENLSETTQAPKAPSDTPPPPPPRGPDGSPPKAPEGGARGRPPVAPWRDDLGGNFGPEQMNGMPPPPKGVRGGDPPAGPSGTRNRLRDETVGGPPETNRVHDPVPVEDLVGVGADKGGGSSPIWKASGDSAGGSSRPPPGRGEAGGGGGESVGPPDGRGRGPRDGGDGRRRSGGRQRARGSGHAKERHGPNRDAKWGRKSQFDSERVIDELIEESNYHPGTTQPNGYTAITFDSGREIGFDRSAGRRTSIVTVITRPDGRVITAYPGEP